MNQGIRIRMNPKVDGYLRKAKKWQEELEKLRMIVLDPVIVLSGFWMWKGHVLRRLISKRSAYQDAAANR